LQSGKVLVVTDSGDEIDAFLNDVSHNGVGFSMLSGSYPPNQVHLTGGAGCANRSGVRFHGSSAS